MKTAGESDHCGTLGMVARDLDGVLDGLGAGTQKQGFLGEVAGHQRIQPLGEVHIGLVGSNVETGVRKRQRLLRHGFHDPRMAMAGVEHGNARREIDVAPAVDIPELRILRLGHINTAATDAGRYRRRFAGFEFGRFRHLRSPVMA
jgi:hypothetical protein